MSKELLKGMLQDLINDRQEEATNNLHDYITAKTQSLLGLTEAKAQYKIKWDGYPGNPKPETHNLDYFTYEMGFDEDDVQGIKSLAVGETYTTGGPTDSVKITRMA